MDPLSKVTALLFSHQIVMKMLHFQTQYYTTHKTMDMYLDKFSEIFDTYLEERQGKEGRIQMKELSLNLVFQTDDTIVEYLKDFQTSLDTYEGLDNLKDLINKVIYLLSFS